MLALQSQGPKADGDTDAEERRTPLPRASQGGGVGKTDIGKGEGSGIFSRPKTVGWNLSRNLSRRSLPEHLCPPHRLPSPGGRAGASGGRLDRHGPPRRHRAGDRDRPLAPPVLSAPIRALKSWGAGVLPARHSSKRQVNPLAPLTRITEPA